MGEGDSEEDRAPSIKPNSSTVVPLFLRLRLVPAPEAELLTVFMHWIALHWIAESVY